jgi:MFS family permease
VTAGGAPRAGRREWVGLGVLALGTLGDRIGRRRLLLLGAAAFGVASAVAAYAASPRHLIAARAVLGVDGATLAEVGDAAAFLACDRAGAMTATFANITSGAFLDEHDRRGRR